MAMARLSGKFSRRALWSPPAAASLGVLSNCSIEAQSKAFGPLQDILYICIEELATIFF